MKKILVLLISFFITLTGHGQSNSKKIQVVLLGTFHFNQSLDSSSKLHSNLFSEKRQAEIDEIVNKLVDFKPNKIFVENEPKEQVFWDSLYNNFRKGIEPNIKRLKSNEIVQLGFKTAQKLNLSQVICVDFQPENYANKDFQANYPIEKTIKKIWDEVETYNDTVRTNAVFFDKRYPAKRPKQDSLLQKVSLKEYILQMNTPESYAYFTWSDWYYLYSIGKKDEYIGTDWLANFWYGRNMRIYRNILTQVDTKKDEKYLIIYGSSHISFLKHLFESNPFFEVISLPNALK